MSLKDQALEQAKRTGELQGRVTGDTEHVEGEVAVQASGASWAARIWARVTARRGEKTDAAAGVDFTKKW